MRSEEITRAISQRPDGIYLSVEGRGRNFSSVVALANQFGGPALFKKIDAETKANFEISTGGAK